MKKIVTLVCIIALFLGCDKTQKPKKPSNLIPKDKMEQVLYDTYLMNAAKGIKKQQLENYGINPEGYIFKKYSIDSLQFALSNEYYAYDSKDYAEMIESVKERLSKEKETYEKLKEEEEEDRNKKRDSIKKLSDSIKRETKRLKDKNFGARD
ncbi:MULTISPECIES: DUF4296 domain-containing protein [Gaetbulibacter]|uniref:DUF4296 domain-containing protein n=1 Tax=Gaetbulibacter jejuensis TaxID=584607 RepID=A0ABP3UMB1_9FLAO|nr:DUF4296 domain-containing protein [Gaetbulibacter sp. NE]